MTQESPNGSHEGTGSPSKTQLNASFPLVDQDSFETLELHEISSDQAAPTQESTDDQLSRDECTDTLTEVVVLPQREGRKFLHRIREFCDCGLESPLDILDIVGKRFPYFIVLISFVEWLIFKFYTTDEMISLCVFHPLRRYEIWRYFTVMLLHGSELHLWGNLIMQLILGSFLEAFHRWKHVGMIYVSGVVFGTLLASVVQPWTFLIGASGGVCALLLAHLCRVILNWNRLGCVFLRCFLILVTYFCFDFYLDVFEEVVDGQKSETSHTGHIGGALGGILVGFIVLQNVEQRLWELRLQKICQVAVVSFLAITIMASAGYQVFYFMSDPELFSEFELDIAEIELD